MKVKVNPVIQSEVENRREEKIRIQRWKLEEQYARYISKKIFDRVVIKGEPIDKDTAEMMREEYLKLRDGGAFEDVAMQIVEAQEAQHHLKLVMLNAAKKINCD